MTSSDLGLFSSSLSMSVLRLIWIQLTECFQSWKSEACPHLAKKTQVVLEEFPGGYDYFASQWDGGDPATPIVVLEKQH